MNYSELVYGIHNSIKAELKDYEYYKTLAKKAPDKHSKEIILNFAKNEKEHAAMLKDAYFKLTGRIAEIESESPEVPNYGAALYNKILEETIDGEKYREYYLSTKIDWLKDIMFRILNDESEHATRGLLLITQINKGQ